MERKRLGETIRQVKLTDLEGIPLRQTYTVGDTTLYRIFDGDTMASEDINLNLELMAEHVNTLEERYSAVIRNEMKAYWANIVTLFGVFIALFSFIITATHVSSHAVPGMPLWYVFLESLARIAPVAIVLVAFVSLIWLVFDFVPARRLRAASKR